MGGRSLIIGGAAAFVSFAYLLTMVMDHPFAGDTSVEGKAEPPDLAARFDETATFCPHP